MATSREDAARSVLVADGAPEGKMEENVLLDAWYVPCTHTLRFPPPPHSAPFAHVACRVPAELPLCARCARSRALRWLLTRRGAP